MSTRQGDIDVSAHTVRQVTPFDADRIAAIYNHYVANTIITFEEEPVPPDEIVERVARVTASHPWLVCEDRDEVIGYAYAAPWHSRCAYRLSVETTVYVDPERLRAGVGTSLYEALLKDLRRRGFRCAIGAIALPNPGSVALHERFGFEKAGQFKDVGWKFDHWVDVGYWQLML